MKKTILILLLVLSLNSAHAQISWEARAGANLSGLSEGDMTMKFGFRGGVGLQYSFNQLFSLKPSIYFSMKGVTDAKNPFQSSNDYKLKLNYLEIPVLASFSFSITDSFAIALNAGPYISFLVNDKPKEFESFKTFETGINGGLDFIFNNKFIVGADALYGLTKISNGSKAPHNYSYSLMMGYRF